MHMNYNLFFHWCFSSTWSECIECGVVHRRKKLWWYCKHLLSDIYSISNVRIAVCWLLICYNNESWFMLTADFISSGSFYFPLVLELSQLLCPNTAELKCIFLSSVVEIITFFVIAFYICFQLAGVENMKIEFSNFSNGYLNDDSSRIWMDRHLNSRQVFAPKSLLGLQMQPHNQFCASWHCCADTWVLATWRKPVK